MYAVIIAHAAIANATKWQIVIGNMNDGIINATTTRATLWHYLMRLLWVTKIIKCQWLLIIVDIVNRFSDILKSYEGQYRAKYFMLHNIAVGLHIVHYGGGYVSLAAINISAYYDIAIA